MSRIVARVSPRFPISRARFRDIRAYARRESTSFNRCRDERNAYETVLGARDDASASNPADSRPFVTHDAASRRFRIVYVSTTMCVPAYFPLC